MITGMDRPSVDVTAQSIRVYRNSDTILGGYKYGTLALQVGGVSDETVKYGFGF
jgi:hypothetical protein